ncbi:MAG: hypothetical protein LBG59_02220 [Candidatus Peribacteria bacterium]|jgi:integrase|nr:hypothetical protein [Candidatus Peribacteria bacterium]
MKIIEEFKTYLNCLPPPKTSRHYGKNNVIAPSTINGKIQTIKNFLKFVNIIYDVGISYIKIESPKSKYPTIVPLTRNEIVELIRYVRKRERKEIDRLRSELLVMLAFTAGMRLQELLNLTIEDLYKSELTIQ